MIVKEKLFLLRQSMKTKGIDAYIVPSSDPHQSEYIAEHWQERKWISGFTGSAGHIVITSSHAGIWTDSRYFIQADVELKRTEYIVHKMENQFASPHIDYLVENLNPKATVALNGLMFSKAEVDLIKKSFAPKKINLLQNEDLISELWTDRPPLNEEEIKFFDIKYAGKSTAEKIFNIRQQMYDLGAKSHLITALDDLAWTFNIRATDVPFNPVVIGYALVAEKKTHLFVNPNRLTEEHKDILHKNRIIVHSYKEVFGFLNKTKKSTPMLIDANLCNQAIFDAINAKKILSTSIPKLHKPIKTKVEITHIKMVMKKDGAALARTFYWLENALEASETIDEVEVAQKLATFRGLHNTYQGESFAAIVGYQANGAIIHYHPMPETCKKISPEGILLVDSGGQYFDGTTDITRTLLLGRPTVEQKQVYTMILKGLIALSQAIFPEGTTGGQLDVLARQFLWNDGKNYLHGTGHGVGFYLNVHEPPQGFAPVHTERGKTVIKPGMLTSNEPGFYKAGEYGMRLENLILSVTSDKPEFLKFETVSLYPFEHELIDIALLTNNEIKWLNEYHKKVFTGISPLLDADLKKWFKEKCREIKNI